MTTLVYIDDVLRTAQLILDAGDVEPTSVSAAECVALAAAVIHQHEMIVAAGLRYARPSAAQARRPLRPGTGVGP